MSPRESIAHYRITAKLGEGGMGAVYRATDTKLNRDVAIKILPDSFNDDPDRLARFAREARVLASLNHPNIAAIYGVEERALVMELVEGAELSGPMPVERALPIVQQLIDALEYAHEKGIVHRDLKPANIKVTPEGRVKVLDFGLAKAMGGQTAVSAPQSASTLTMGATLAGVIMGTAGYMAPEQARGEEADKRADIWAFGAVVYELMTGQQLFAGPTVSDSLAAVLTRDPELDRVAPQLRKLVRLCLLRDVKQRLRDIGDARIAIADGTAALSAGPAPVASRSRLPWILVAALALISLSMAVLWWRRPVEEARMVKFTVPSPDDSLFYDTNPAILPDGRRIIFGAAQRGRPQLWVRDLDAIEARALPGTEGGLFPFWSPDSRFVGFFANGKLKKIEISGGPASTLCDAPTPRGGGGSWSNRDVIVFQGGSSKALARVAASGGSPVPVTEPDDSRMENSHTFPSFLPDGRHFLYLARSSDPEKIAVWVGDLDSKTRKLILNVASNAVYDPAGRILFMRENNLVAQPFDAKRLETAGEPVRVAERVDQNSYSLGAFSISRTGALAYYSGSGGIRQLTWFDRTGKRTGTVGPPGRMVAPAISPDGARVVVERADEKTGRYHLWMHDLAHDSSLRFTFEERSQMYPAWSPDGSRVIYTSNQSGPVGIYMKPANGTSKEELLFDPLKEVKRNTTWSPGTKFLFFTSVGENTGEDIWVLPNPLDPAERKPYPFLQSAANEGYGGDLSPNGKYLAYASDENGSWQIYVQSFPGKEEKVQISTAGGLRPVWNRNGKELFYPAPNGKLMVVDVKFGLKFEHGVPKPLFDLPITATNERFDVSPDGQRFLAPVDAGKAGNRSINVVLNWRAEAKN